MTQFTAVSHTSVLMFNLLSLLLTQDNDATSYYEVSQLEGAACSSVYSLHSVCDATLHTASEVQKLHRFRV